MQEIRLFSSSLVLLGNSAISAPDSLIVDLARSGLDKVFFNLQGDEVTHESISCTPGSYESVISSAKRFREHGVYVGFHFVPMKVNFKQLDHVVKLAHGLDVNEVALLRFVPQGRGDMNKEQLSLNKEQHQELIHDAYLLRSAYRIPAIRIGCPFNEFTRFSDENPKVCPAGGTMCHVLINGQVAPCSAFKWDRKVHAGNIESSDLESLATIGFNQFRQLRSEFRAEKLCTAQLLHELKEPQAIVVRRLLATNVRE